MGKVDSSRSVEVGRGCEWRTGGSDIGPGSGDVA
jgi:hypothetical protein